MREGSIRIFYATWAFVFSLTSAPPPSVHIAVRPAVMFEAFELFKLVEKLPLRICALATWGECMP